MRRVSRSKKAICWAVLHGQHETEGIHEVTLRIVVVIVSGPRLQGARAAQPEEFINVVTREW